VTYTPRIVPEDDNGYVYSRNTQCLKCGKDSDYVYPFAQTIEYWCKKHFPYGKTKHLKGVNKWKRKLKTLLRFW
jgi:hypothetical protein